VLQGLLGQKVGSGRIETDIIAKGVDSLLDGGGGHALLPPTGHPSSQHPDKARPQASHEFSVVRVDRQGLLAHAPPRIKFLAEEKRGHFGVQGAHVARVQFHRVSSDGQGATDRW
jgi:hypothetical protein